jgi:hypothetical protein
LAALPAYQVVQEVLQALVALAALPAYQVAQEVLQALVALVALVAYLVVLPVCLYLRQSFFSPPHGKVQPSH